MKSFIWVSLFAGVLLLSSCATSKSGQDSQADIDVKNGLVVRDFVVAATQVFNPILTTVQLNAPRTAFGTELEVGFKEVGYGMQRVSSDHGPKFLSYTRTLSENSGNVATATYKIYMGDVGLERTYAILNGGGIAPNGPMIVTGTELPISLNPDLFPGQSVEVKYVAEEQVKFDANTITVIDFETMGGIAKLVNKDLPSYKSLNSQNQEIENLFNQGASNFESIDESYRTVRKDIIVFDDDSLVLKTRGRQQVAKLLKYFDPKTDVFRLIGCSIGTTSHKGGNVELALGRSERVANELVARSVEVDAIFDEGCWAPTIGEPESAEYPARAVVVQLQRRS